MKGRDAGREAREEEEEEGSIMGKKSKVEAERTKPGRQEEKE